MITKSKEDGKKPIQKKMKKKGVKKPKNLLPMFVKIKLGIKSIALLNAKKHLSSVLFYKY